MASVVPTPVQFLLLATTTTIIIIIIINRAEEKLTGLYPPCRYVTTPELSLK